VLGRRGALVGPHGSGKTTLLDALADRLVASGVRVVRLRLGSDDPMPGWTTLGRTIAECGREGVLCLDGIDLLGTPTRLWLRARTRSLHGLLVTAHSPGPVPTLHATHTSPALLAELAAELLGASPDALRPGLDPLFERCRGNLREALFALYAQAADDGVQPAPAHRAG